MGLTVLDAGVVIGVLDGADAHHPAARAAVAAARDRNDRLVAPASVYAEILVGPSRRGPEAVATVTRFVERLPLDVEPLGTGAAMLAAGFRARHPALKLPDALVVATAVHLGADHLVTTDRGWPSPAVLGFAGSLDVI